ncbi:hypothetical protein MMC17_005641 [Xylographa soralifera]|nr:hypothetical protein [Xylographa soralifera]
MAPDYTKHKNAELEQLLRVRSLPHTGKKADLIARLIQDDSDKAPTATAPSSTAPAEDEIDWDDDAAKAPTATDPALAPLPAHAGPGRAANPLAVPNQTPAIDPSTTHDLTITQPATQAQPPDPAPTYHPPAPTLPPVEVEAELRKRLARAQKYHLPAEVVFEAEKALERFVKFGAGTEVLGKGGLEVGLPERGRGKRGRGGEEDGAGEGGGGKRVDSRRREGGRGGGRGRSGERRGRGKSGERSADRNGVKLGGQGVKEKDRAAAEARKARFGATA